MTGCSSSKAEGQVWKHHHVPGLRRMRKLVHRARFFLGSGIFLLVAEWFYWHESESLWVICIRNETTLFHSASAHFIIERESKEKFCFLSGFPQMISHWWLTCPQQNCMRWWNHSLYCQQPRQRQLPSTLAPAMIYHFQMLHLTTNLRCAAFSARNFHS